MTKIAINSCYGGFGLSEEVLMRYAELQGYKPGIYVEDEFHTKVIIVPRSEYIEQNNLVKSLRGGDKDLYHQERKVLEGMVVWGFDIKRDDPLLIRAIEETGEKESSDCLGAIKVVEIPDDVDWEIKEYDGAEWVAERHRTWS